MCICNHECVVGVNRKLFVFAERQASVRPLRAALEAHVRALDFRSDLYDITSMKKSVIESKSDVMGGTPVFRGTRVPVQTLFDYLEGGDSIAEFLKGFPTVSEKQVIAVLEEMKEKLLVPVHA